MRFAATLVLVVLAALSCAARVSAQTLVSTLAGSGETGFADGPSATASFMLPMGLAYDRDGNLYVADGAAQRIRVVQRNGIVRTLAGSGQPDASGTWVPGGYADGDAAHARFNRPADVAVAADGRVFVADSYNHCIRVIAPNGVVSTFVGSPTRSGPQSGPRDVAAFVEPTALAFDRQGNLFVVDTGTVREVDPSGTVSTVALGLGAIPAAGIALTQTSQGTGLFVPVLDGLYVRRTDGRQAMFIASLYRSQCIGKTAPSWWDCSGSDERIREHRDIGVPWGVVALDDHSVVYADWRTSSIRLLNVRDDTQRLLAGYPFGDASGRGGGHQDGPGASASFNLPLGLALAPDGSVAIADAGSRRIRILGGIDRSEPISTAQLADTPSVPGTRTIVYAGDSTVWEGTVWSDSIEGRLEGLAGDKTRVVPLVLAPMWDDVQTLASMPGHHADALLLQLNMLDVAAIAQLSLDQATVSPRAWRQPLETSLGRLRAALAASGTRLEIVLAPLPRDVGPATMFWARALDTAFATSTETQWLAGALGRMGFSVVDATPLFARAAAAPEPVPLFATGEYEFAAGGRDAMARAAFAALNAAGS